VIRLVFVVQHPIAVKAVEWVQVADQADQSGIAKDSPFFHVPEALILLAETFMTDYYVKALWFLKTLPAGRDATWTLARGTPMTKGRKILSHFGQFFTAEFFRAIAEDRIIPVFSRMYSHTLANGQRKEKTA
jgi:hypothetical protein